MPISLKLRLNDPPPSVNQAWRMFRGHMVRSAEFKNWEKAAIVEAQKQVDGAKLPTWCYWRTDIAIPRSKTRIDADNAGKAIHDALKKSGLTPDDFYLVDTRARYWAGDYLLITIHEAETEEWLKVMAPCREIAKKIRSHSTWTPRA
jgi:Holliday junction resolvase RusA-like endonuclease